MSYRMHASIVAVVLALPVSAAAQAAAQRRPSAPRGGPPMA